MGDMKRISLQMLSALVTLCMALALLPGIAHAATSGSCGGNVTWSYSDGTLTIQGTGRMIEYSITSQPWYAYHDQIRTVMIRGGVTNISVGMFSFYPNLISINVTDGNPDYCSVDGVLFNADQTILHTYPQGKSDPSYNIPTSVTKIEDVAFYSCNNLTSVNISDGVTAIGDTAFGGCSSLASVTIPASVTSIGMGAFGVCTSLADVYYGGSESQWRQITIGDWNDPWLTSATIHYSENSSIPNDNTPQISSGIENDNSVADDDNNSENGDVIGDGDVAGENNNTSGGNSTENDNSATDIDNNEFPVVPIIAAAVVAVATVAVVLVLVRKKK